MNIFVQVNKKSIRIEPSPEEKKAYVKRIRYAMELKDKEIIAKEQDIKARGTCPICHLVLPLTKYCSKCQKTYN